jgi:transcriptional regulator MraZ
MFYGEYDHTLDDKSRVTLPARFREALAGGVVLAKGFDRNLDVYPGDAWESVVQSRIAELDPFSAETRRLKRVVFAGAAADTPDKQGRVLVPAALAEYAGLAKDVVVAGVDDHLEIWDRAAWSEQLREVEGSVHDVAERLAEKRS